MTHNVQQVLHSALALTDEEQLQLASALLAAIDERGLRPFDDEWLAEIERRSADYDAGNVAPIPWDEVKARRRVSNDA